MPSFTRVLTGATGLSRRNFGACEWNNRIVMAGGIRGSTYLNDVWESSDGVNWNLLATGSASFEPRDGLVLLVHDNCLVVMGGWNGTKYFDDVWISRDGTQWDRIANNKYTARDEMAAFSLDKRLFVVGGDDTGTNGNYMDDVWMSPDMTTWKRLLNNQPMFQRTVPAYCVFNNRMHVICGYDGTSRLDTAIYSENGEHWHITGPTCGLPARDDMAATVFNNKIVVSGGYSSRLQVTSVHSDLFYSEDGEKYAVGDRNMGFSVYQHKLVALKNPNRLFSLFGYDGSAVRTDVWRSEGNWEGEIA
jgi:hypothetical protein